MVLNDELSEIDWYFDEEFDEWTGVFIFDGDSSYPAFVVRELSYPAAESVLCTDSLIDRILLETGFEAQCDGSWFLRERDNYSEQPKWIFWRKYDQGFCLVQRF